MRACRVISTAGQLGDARLQLHQRQRSDLRGPLHQLMDDGQVSVS